MKAIRHVQVHLLPPLPTARLQGQTERDMKRLDDGTDLPLISMLEHRLCLRTTLVDMTCSPSTPLRVEAKQQ